jgi:hypothetical protein
MFMAFCIVVVFVLLVSLAMLCYLNNGYMLYCTCLFSVFLLLDFCNYFRYDGEHSERACLLIKQISHRYYYCFYMH